MKQSLATILAFAIAPVVPALAISLMFYGQFDVASLVTFPLVYLPALLATALFGGPAFALGRRLDLIRWWSGIVVGFLVGALVVMLVAGTAGRLWFQPEAFFLYAGSGAVVGFVFWSIWWLGHRD